MSGLDLYEAQTAERLSRLTPVQTVDPGVFDTIMQSLPSILGGGLASTLLLFPVAYLALAGQFKFKMSDGRKILLFLLCVPLVGAIQLALGGVDSTLAYGFLELFAVPLLVPLLVCLAVIFVAYQFDRGRIRFPPSPLRWLGSTPSTPSTPTTRAGFVVLVASTLTFFVALAFHLLTFRYSRFDLWDFLFAEYMGHRGIDVWIARISACTALLSYVLAYHYDRTVGRLLRWVRSGE